MRYTYLALAVATGVLPLYGETTVVASATSDPVPVEVSIGGAYTLRGEKSVALDANYSGVSIPEGSQVVLLKVERPDTSYATTSVVKTCSSAVADDCLLQAGQDGGQYFRLIQELRSSSGQILGQRLVGDISVVRSSVDSGLVSVDSRPESFQEAVADGGTLPLAYDSAWCTNGIPAGVEIMCVKDRYSNGELRSSATNSLFAAAAPASGDYGAKVSVRGGGTFTYSLVFRDALGEILDDSLRATCRFREIWGAKIILK